MKGVLFTEFLELVEKEHGIELLDAVISHAAPKLSTGGAYTSVGTYPHAELLALLEALLSQVDADLGLVLGAYANRLMAAFEKSYPDFFAQHNELFSFLNNVEGQMHAGVRKIYPEAKPPVLDVVEQSNELLHLSYRSHRPLSVVVEHLVRAAALRYETEIDVTVAEVNEEGTQTMLEIRKLS